MPVRSCALLPVSGDVNPIPPSRGEKATLPDFYRKYSVLTPFSHGDRCEYALLYTCGGATRLHLDA